jgi:ornithine carbamoyltransferase
LTLTDDRKHALDGADFVCTDVWVSMGEPKEVWAERVRLLAPFQVNRQALEEPASAREVHALPARLP